VLLSALLVVVKRIRIVGYAPSQTKQKKQNFQLYSKAKEI